MTEVQGGGAPVRKDVPSSSAAGTVSISGSQGVQAGWGNTQVNNFFSLASHMYLNVSSRTIGTRLEKRRASWEK